MLIGGLFGAASEGLDLNVDWHGAQQVAYIIRLGTMLRDRIQMMEQEWSTKIRENSQSDRQDGQDPAFYGRHSLLNTDQGVRGSCRLPTIFLWSTWTGSSFGNGIRMNLVAPKTMTPSTRPCGLCYRTVRQTCSMNSWTELATFDWRTSTAQA